MFGVKFIELYGTVGFIAIWDFSQGHCGIPELKEFVAALPGYQIEVMSIDPPHVITYAGPTPLDKIICLIKEGEHYDGCNSLADCLANLTSVTNATKVTITTICVANQPCKGKWCPSCRHKTCPDFIEAK